MKKIYQLPYSLNDRETLIAVENRNWTIAVNQSKTGQNFVSQSFFSNLTAVFRKVSVSHYGLARIQTGFKTMTVEEQYAMAHAVNQTIFENTDAYTLLNLQGLPPLECFVAMDTHYSLNLPDSTIFETLKLPELKIIKGRAK